MIQKAVADGDIKGFSLYRNVPQISHLFCMDDTLPFCFAEQRDIHAIQNRLGQYEATLGQKINKKKMNLFFGKLAYKASKNSIKNILGVHEVKEYESYLGLPVIMWNFFKRKKNAINILWTWWYKQMKEWNACLWKRHKKHKYNYEKQDRKYMLEWILREGITLEVKEIRSL